MSPAHLQLFILVRHSLLKPGYEGETCFEVKVKMISQIWGTKDL